MTISAKRIDSVQFAKYLLYIAREYGITGMNMTKLQKLLYAVDGVLLANGFNLIDENCRAWPYGPVYPNVFSQLKSLEPYQSGEVLNNENIDFINKAIFLVFDKLGKYNATTLSNWSHSKGSPWSQTERNDVISKELMAEFFK